MLTTGSAEPVRTLYICLSEFMSSDVLLYVYRNLHECYVWLSVFVYFDFLFEFWLSECICINAYTDTLKAYSNKVKFYILFLQASTLRIYIKFGGVCISFLF